MNVKRQGKVLIQLDKDDLKQQTFYIMFPNGDVEIALSKAKAEARVKAWFKRRVGKESWIGQIEWS